MSLRQDARRHMASALGDQFMDPIFQLQQPALDAPPVVSAVLPPAPPAAPLASSSGPGQEDQSHDGGPDDPGHSQKAGTGGIASTQRTRFAIPPGLDTSTADLTYRRNARSFSVNNPSPEGWAYPHKKGIGTGSNLEAFKAEIEARTRRGENCKTIADALVAMGVQTSDRAVSRVRIKWGMRKRVSKHGVDDKQAHSSPLQRWWADCVRRPSGRQGRLRPKARLRASVQRPKSRPCASSRSLA